MNQKNGCGRRRIALAAVLLVVALVGALFGWMALQARVTHVRKAVVYLDDLPSALDGTTLLYVIGSVLVVGAAVLLIVKKRMGAEK